MPDSEEEAATPVVPDADLLGALELARASLLEITAEENVGEPAGHLVEGENTLSLLFEASMTGYPGWLWTVSVGRVDGEAPTVLEAELMPGEHALLAPEWVPWSDRLAELSADESDDDEADDDDDADGDAYDDDVDIDVFGDDSPIGEVAADSDPAALDLNDDDAENAEDEADDAGAQPSSVGVEPIVPDQHSDESE